jgi:NADH-quinone oxidoreductase subunit L
VIHALHDEQDVRKMGGLRKKTPLAFWAMLVGVLTISGIPPFSGFFSKDLVIYGALEHGHPWLYAIGILTAGITAYYMFRLFFVAFLGEYRGDAAASHGHHGPSWIMEAPVAILILPSAAIGGLLLYGGDDSPLARFFAPLFSAQPLPAPMLSEGATSILTLAVVAVGLAVAWMRYATRSALADAPERLRRESAAMPALLANAFYVDAAIDLLFVRTSQLLGALFGWLLDPRAIDGAVRELAHSARWLGTLVRSFQTGLVRAYALILVLGAACFMLYYALAGGAH